MRLRRGLAGAAVASLALLPAGCGSGPIYKGGEVPQPPEGGTREPGNDISSLDELRGVLVRITPDGFEPRDVAIEGADSVSWRNTDTESHIVRKVKGQGRDFRSRPMKPGQIYQRTFIDPGKTVVEVDTEPKQRMTVTIIK